MPRASRKYHPFNERTAHRQSSARLSLLSSLLPLLFLVAGCGAASEDVTVFNIWGVGGEGEIVKQLVLNFERQHPGIRMRVQQIPWTARAPGSASRTSRFRCWRRPDYPLNTRQR